jgi:hypothetical protein
MEQDADSKWTFEPWIDELVKDRDAMADKYISLVKKWNANVDDYNRIVRPRNVGRPHPM